MLKIRSGSQSRADCKYVLALTVCKWIFDTRIFVSLHRATGQNC